RRQGVRLALIKSAVEFGQFASHYAHRPAIRDDVMHRDKQHVLGRAEDDELPADQRTGLEIEGSIGFLGRQPLELCVGILLPAEAAYFECETTVLRGDPLDRLTIHRDEGRAQRFVTSYQAIERANKRYPVQFTFQTQTHRNVIGLTDTLHLRQEP